MKLIMLLFNVVKKMDENVFEIYLINTFFFSFLSKLFYNFHIYFGVTTLETLSKKGYLYQTSNNLLLSSWSWKSKAIREIYKFFKLFQNHRPIETW